MQLATLCFLKKDGKTLMILRDKKPHRHQNTWNGLGGKFEGSESPEECVIREVREESGLTIKNPRMRGVITFDNGGDIPGWMVFIFEAKDFEGELMETEEGTLAWINDEDIPTIPMPGDDKEYLMKRLEKEDFFSAKFIYENGEIADHTKHRVSFY